jgi:hypothetical protein
MSTFRYGTSDHATAEVKLVSYYKRANYSKRNVRTSLTVGMFVHGWVIADSVANITARITAIENAYAVDGQDAVLLLDDGSESPHQLKSSRSDCITGVRVLEFQWVDNDPAEYVTGRHFTAQLEAEYIDAGSQVIFWYESLRFIGNTGPCWELVELPVGPPVPFVSCQQTTQTIIQSGKSLGYLGYVLPFGSLWPDSEHQNRRIFEPGDPEFQGNLLVNYPCEWAYFHSRSVYTEGLPTMR